MAGIWRITVNQWVWATFARNSLRLHSSVRLLLLESQFDCVNLYHVTKYYFKSNILLVSTKSPACNR